MGFQLWRTRAEEFRTSVGSVAGRSPLILALAAMSSKSLALVSPILRKAEIKTGQVTSALSG
jgi:hypothetical protein